MGDFYIKDRKDVFDMRELLKEDIYDYRDHNVIKVQPATRQDIINHENRSVEKVVKSIFPKVSENLEQYVILDSTVKLRTSDTRNGEFEWIFNSQGVTTNESIGVHDVISNITSIQIGTFYIPIIEDSVYWDSSVENFGSVMLYKNNTTPVPQAPPTMIRQDGNYGQYTYSILFDTETYRFPWPNNPYSQIPFANRVSIQIKEAGLQSYSDCNNNRFNFEFLAMHNNRINGNPNFIQVKPINGAKWDEYVFNKPIDNLKSITLIFRNPDYPISFEPDVFYDVEINLGFGWSEKYFIIINTPFDHKLCAGDRIYIKDFIPLLADGSQNTNFPPYLLKYILRNNGHAVNIPDPGSPFIPLDPARPLTASPYSFGLDPAVRILEPLDPNIAVSFPSKVNVQIAKRRIRIPVKIKSIRTSVRNET